MKYYVVTYRGDFGFIKPWSAVRDSETFSQQFLTPSIIEGMRQKLEVESILRHKLTYAALNSQQEVIQSKAFEKKRNQYSRTKSILIRSVMINPALTLAFSSFEDAHKASKQHLCLCRNEDIIFPFGSVKEMEEEAFNELDGFELRFGNHEKAFMVGYNRFDENKPMKGWIEITGNPIKNVEYEYF